MLATVVAPPLEAQVEARPELRGRVLRNGEGVPEGTVTLHQVTPDSAGELATTPVDTDGHFSFRLPTVPDPAGRSDVYFASIRHQGILYFGRAVTRAVQLDSLYRIEVYDTAAAPAGGTDFPVEVRNLFLEELGEGQGWQVVDLLQIRHQGPRTLVTRNDEPLWSYPMPPEASDFRIGESDIDPGGATYEDGTLRVTSPVPPGQRTYLVRYRLPSLEFTLPLPGRTRRLELMVREPAPALEAPGLTRGEAVELEPGSSYRRYAASELQGRVVDVSLAEESGEVDVRWIAVILALVLAGAGLLVVQRGGHPPEPAAGEGEGVGPGPCEATREDVLLRVAELDEAFEAADDPSEDERRRYRDERRRLMERLRALD